MAKLKSIYPTYFPKYLPIDQTKGDLNWNQGKKLAG